MCIQLDLHGNFDREKDSIHLCMATVRFFQALWISEKKRGRKTLAWPNLCALKSLLLRLEKITEVSTVSTQQFPFLLHGAGIFTYITG